MVKKLLSNKNTQMKYKKPLIKVIDSTTHRYLMDTIYWGGSEPPEEGDAKRGFFENEELEPNNSYNIWHQE